MRIVSSEKDVKLEHAVEFELNDGIVMHFWRKQRCTQISKKANERFQTTDEDVKEILEIYNKLGDTIDNFNRMYGLTVRTLIIC